MSDSEHQSTDFATILDRRFSRRSVLRVAGATAAVAATPASLLAMSQKPDESIESELKQSASSLTFQEVAPVLDKQHHLPPGYSAKIVMRWGDAVEADAPAFDAHQQTPSAQAKQFGYNNDFIAYFPLHEKQDSTHGLLCVNHEYTVPELMFDGYPDRKKAADQITDKEHRVEMQAHGVSVLEVRKTDSGWEPVASDYNRRITATTPMSVEGPAAGHARMQTNADPDGTTILGTFGNCAGGMTPWGTYLTCEENVDVYFLLKGYDGDELNNHKAMTIGSRYYHRWDKVDERFDVSKEPNEPNRFGWVVEIDPRDPDSMPVKRTALGRFKHEGASCVVNKDGRVAVYMGDDQAFQFIYKFLSREHYDPNNPNPHLLDEGTLYAAQFHEDGTLKWLPLVQGQGLLTAENGFVSQADVVIEARRAAALMGATPMDRPEGVVVNRTACTIYAAMTKNPLRTTTDMVSRRANNPMGYIVSMQPPKLNHSADTYTWDLFLEGGDPNAKGNEKGFYKTPPSDKGWLACPDNLVVDVKGRLWITTDGQPDAVNRADGVFAADTTGDAKGQTKCFFRGPVGCEVTGPQFTPDCKTFFISVQHPGEGSSFAKPSTRWPDFNDKVPPRPAVLAITKDDGDLIGG